MGYSKVPLEVDNGETDEFKDVKEYHDEMFVWTYSSPEFPMAQVTFLETSLILLLFLQKLSGKDLLDFARKITDIVPL